MNQSPTESTPTRAPCCGHSFAGHDRGGCDTEGCGCELSRMQVADALAARIAALESFVRKFADNFDTCDTCNGKGHDKHGDACHVCGGTAKQITSRGVMLADLEPEARALLAKVQS